MGMVDGASPKNGSKLAGCSSITTFAGGPLSRCSEPRASDLFFTRSETRR